MSTYIGHEYKTSTIVIAVVVAVILIGGAFLSSIQSRQEWNNLTPKQRCATEQQNNITQVGIECTTLDRFPN